MFDALPVGDYCRCDTSGVTRKKTTCLYALVFFVNLITFTYKYKYEHTRATTTPR